MCVRRAMLFAASERMCSQCTRHSPMFPLSTAPTHIHTHTHTSHTFRARTHRTTDRSALKSIDVCDGISDRSGAHTHTHYTPYTLLVLESAATYSVEERLCDGLDVRFIVSTAATTTRSQAACVCSDFLFFPVAAYIVYSRSSTHKAKKSCVYGRRNFDI